MKKIIILFAVIFSLSNFNILKAYDTTAAKYMPLQIGNTWVYYSAGYGYPYIGDWYNKYKITRTIDTLGHRYYVFTVTNVFVSGINTYPFGPNLVMMRIDSATMNILQPGTSCGNNEVIYDSLLSKKYDSVWICRTSGIIAECNDTSAYNIFGTTSQSKHTLRLIPIESSEGKIYSKDIGLVYDNFTGMGFGWYSYLRGCVVNGVLSGDTNMLVGIKNISAEVPGSFSISQNYPNPFNPVTKIEFDLPAVGQRHAFDVQLIIYDVLGRQVVTLLNQQLQPGSYSVDWDASNYPSGVYFYKLVVGDNTNNGGGFTQTKKMLLIK